VGEAAEDRLQQLYPEVFGRSRPLPPDRPHVEVEMDGDDVIIITKSYR
jgi:hypothetical protein